MTDEDRVHEARLERRLARARDVTRAVIDEHPEWRALSAAEMMDRLFTEVVRRLRT